MWPESDHLSQYAGIFMANSMTCYNSSESVECLLIQTTFLWVIMLIEVKIAYRHFYSSLHWKQDIKIEWLCSEVITNQGLLPKFMGFMISAYESTGLWMCGELVLMFLITWP